MSFLPNANSMGRGGIPNLNPDSKEGQAVIIAMELTDIAKGIVLGLAEGNVEEAKKQSNILEDRIKKLDPANNESDRIAVGTIVLTLTVLSGGVNGVA